MPLSVEFSEVKTTTLAVLKWQLICAINVDRIFQVGLKPRRPQHVQSRSRLSGRPISISILCLIRSLVGHVWFVVQTNACMYASVIDCVRMRNIMRLGILMINRFINLIILRFIGFLNVFVMLVDYVKLCMC